MVRNLRFRIGYHVRLHLMNLLFRPAKGYPVELLGSDWGGWSVVSASLNTDSVIYSGGIGHDASFDIAISERYGCTVHGFDPTPVGRTRGEEVAASYPLFKFHPWGLWNEDGVARFSAPRNPAHDSFSIVNLEGTEDSVPGEVRKLQTIMRELAHSHLDVLKIDIEGAEYAVLSDLLREGIVVRQLCVEFDQPTKLRTMYTMVRRLQREGFQLVARRQWDYTFVHRSIADSALRASGSASTR